MYTIDVDHETLSRATVDLLIDDYRSVVKDIEGLKSVKNLKDYQKQDLEDSLKIKKALKRVIKYYSVPGSVDYIFDE
jgi:hypothetical protein